MDRATVEIRTAASTPISRRAFIGSVATLAAAAAVPVMSNAASAGAAAGLAPPYSLATWQALLNTTITAVGPDGRQHTLKVAKLIVLEPPRAGMSGEAFIVGFRASEPMTEAIYSLTASPAGTFPMLLSGSTGALALINTQLPAAA